MKASHGTIDAIRAVAALAVAWSHIWYLVAESSGRGEGWLWAAVHASASFGHDAVIIFFVVSGYWITSSVVGRVRRDRWAWQEYGVDRLTRLWIVLLPALAIGGTLDSIGRYWLDLPIYSSLPVPSQQPVDIASRLQLENWLSSIFFLNDVLAKALGSNGPLWSLTAEFWYYVWFPLLYLQFARRRISIPLSLVLLATMMVCANLLYLFPCWLVGSLIFLVRDRIDARASVLHQGQRTLCIGGSAAAFLLGLYVSHLYVLDGAISSFLLAVGFGMLLASILAFDIGLPRWMAPVSAFGANSSFSLYAIHYPLLMMAQALIDPANALRANPVSLALALALLAGITFAAFAFSLVTEHRTTWVREKLRKRLNN